MARGAYYYTVGQRRGFTITKKTAEEKPHYVISKNVLSNEITVQTVQLSRDVSSSRKIIISGVNWIHGRLLISAENIKAGFDIDQLAKLFRRLCPKRLTVSNVENTNKAKICFEICGYF